MPSQRERPRLSVIVPVRNGLQYLPQSLTALRGSDLPASRWELIVVDDSSHDGSGDLAGRYADRVIRLLDGPCGPAIARNHGVAVARGELLAFIDADVRVHRDTLRLMVETFDADQAVSAVFGAYDLTPSAPGLVSQYRNLLHRYVHERDAGSSVTFWTGCGAVRASVFASCGGFDEANTSIEDIELGYRMSGLGHRILLRPEIQGTHLKQWTFRSMVATDLRARGIPWARLLLSRKVRPAATLNLRLPEQCATLAVGLACLALAVWLVTGERIWLAVAVAGVMAMLVLNAPLLSWFARHRGWWFAARTAPLRVVYYVLNGMSVIVALLLPAPEQRDGSSRAPHMVAPSGSSAN